MNLNCVQESLKQGLTRVGRALAAHAALPVLTHVLLETRQGGLRLAATDLELTIVHWLPAAVQQTGAFTVPGPAFTEWIGSLGQGGTSVQLSVDDAQTALQVHAATMQATFRGLPAAEFPALPEYAAVECLAQVAVEPLRNALQAVVIAAAADQSQPVLTGVLWTFTGDQLTLTAADGYRLARQVLSLPQAVAQDAQFIVPARACAELLRLLGKTGTVTFAAPQPPTQLIARLDEQETVLVAQLLDGAFPAVSRVIPTHSQVTATVNREELRQALRRLAIFARDASNQVRVALGPAGLEIGSAASACGEGQAQLAAQVDGAALTLHINYRYLLQPLEALTATTVTLSCTEPHKPVLLRPATDDAYVYVAMPLA